MSLRLVGEASLDPCPTRRRDVRSYSSSAPRAIALKFGNWPPSPLRAVLFEEARSGQASFENRNGLEKRSVGVKN